MDLPDKTVACALQKYCSHDLHSFYSFQKITFDMYRRKVRHTKGHQMYHALDHCTKPRLMFWNIQTFSLHFSLTKEHVLSTSYYEVESEVQCVPWGVSSCFFWTSYFDSNQHWFWALNNCVFCSLVKYTTTYKSHDPFLAPCTPSNPWQTDNDTYWTLNTRRWAPVVYFLDSSFNSNR